MSASPPSIPAQQVGLHVVESEGPDLLILRAIGDLSADEARKLILIDRQQAKRNGYSLILIDGRKCGRIGADARKAMFAEMQLHPGYIGSTAMFGLAGPVVLMMKLVLRAVALLGTSFDDEMQIFTTEVESRAFLAQRRPLRQKQTLNRRG